MKLLTPKQMAEVLQVSAKTFNRWRKRYKIPYYGAGKAVRFNESEVLARLRTDPSRIETSSLPKMKPAYSEKELEILKRIGINRS